jgi:putative oxidoreductase
MTAKFILNWILIIAVFIILMYNAYLKLSSNPGAVTLFSSLGMEPYGRFLLGSLELTAALLLLYPATLKYGAALGALLMAGVILIHIFKLGIALNGDYRFFIMGLSAFLCCTALLWLSTQKLFNSIIL